MILMPGVTASIWGPTVAMPADAMGVTLDSIDEAHRVIHADEEQPSPSPRLSTTTGSCTSRATTCLYCGGITARRYCAMRRTGSAG
jgi:hypothetical protein